MVYLAAVILGIFFIVYYFLFVFQFSFLADGYNLITLNDTLGPLFKNSACVSAKQRYSLFSSVCFTVHYSVQIIIFRSLFTLEYIPLFGIRWEFGLSFLQITS